MKNLFKRTFQVLAILIVLTITGLSIFLYSLNPNQYKVELSESIKSMTGYDAQFNGNIKFAFLPDFRLEFANVILSKDHAQVANIPYMSGSLSLIDLLKHHVNLKKIQIKQATITISNSITNKEKTNHTQLKKQTSVTINQAQIDKLKSFNLSALNIEQTKLIINDAGKKIQFGPFNLAAYNVNIVDNIALQIEGPFKVTSKDFNLFTKIKFKGDLKLDLKKLLIDPLKAYHFSSKINLPKMVINRVKIDNIFATVTSNGAVIHGNLQQLKMYKGLAKGQFEFSPTNSHTVLNLELNHMKVGKFLQDLNSTQIVDGLLTAKIKLNTHGQTSQEKSHNLNGSILAKIDNGVLNSIDINGLVSSINKIISKKRSFKQYLAMTLNHFQSNDNFQNAPTPFEFMTAHVRIKNGVASTKTIKIHTKTLDIKGEGSFTLVSQLLNFKLSANMSHPQGTLKKTLKVLDGGIPFIIKGQINHLSVQPDMNVIMAKVKSNLLNDSDQSLTTTLDSLKKKLPKLDQLL